jgi:hypothetical protein
MALFDTLPDGWLPKITDLDVERASRRFASRREKLKPRVPQRAVVEWEQPRKNSNYCCICGLTGECWTTGGDCRLMPVLQRSKGEC